jgi:hypothetical protein
MNIPKKVPAKTRRASKRRTAFGNRHPKEVEEALKQPNLLLLMSDEFTDIIWMKGEHTQPIQQRHSPYL